MSEKTRTASAHSPPQGKKAGNIKAGMEDSYRGIGASRGIAIGKTYAFEKEQFEHEVKSLKPKEIDEEIERLVTALQRSEKELKKIERVTARKLGKGYANLPKIGRASCRERV